jgi:DNA-binding transcriptional LysR family regulator
MKAVSPGDMVLFAAVVREGSFTRGARSLGITKQTASERVARLEEHLGVRLLERTTRSLRPTAAGAAYAERCNAIAAQVEEANREVQQQQLEATGVLRVSAPVLYGRRFLTPVMVAYLKRYPKVRVELVLSDRRVDLVEEGIDLAIRIGALDDSTLSARKLGEGRVFYVASPKFLARHGQPTPASLPRLPTIGMRAAETWEWRTGQVRVEPRLVVNDLELVAAAAVAGLGVARLPSLVCQDEVDRGRLQVLAHFPAATQRPVCAVFPSRKHLPARVRFFLEALVAHLEPMA